MPIRSEDLEDLGLPEHPATRLHREAAMNLLGGRLHVRTIDRDALPSKAELTGRWILGFAYNALASFFYPECYRHRYDPAAHEAMKWWVGRLPDGVPPDREIMDKLERAEVRTVAEMFLWKDPDGAEFAVIHFNLLLSDQEACGIFRSFLGFRRSAGST